MYAPTLIAQKGGMGNAALAVNLSVTAEAAGVRVDLVHLGPQASAAGWGGDRDGERRGGPVHEA